MTSQSVVGAAPGSETFWVKTANDPVALFTALLALFTLGLWIFTGLMWWITRRAVNETAENSLVQGLDMRESIKESARAALAMERVAESMSSNVKSLVESVNINREMLNNQRRFGETQLRAYITALVGPCLYQDKDVLFQARVRLLNLGATAARDLRWNISSAILPVPIPDDFKFPLAEKTIGGGTIGSQQDAMITGQALDKIPDDQALSTRRGINQSLYVWGVVSYRDIFRRRHKTVFAQQLFWIPGSPTKKGSTEIAQVHYLDKHNCTN